MVIQDMVIQNIASDQIRVKDCYQHSRNGLEVALFTGLSRWAPLSVTLSNGECRVSAVIDATGKDFDVIDSEGYFHLNRGCRYTARELHERYLGENAKVQVKMSLPKNTATA